MYKEGHLHKNLKGTVTEKTPSCSVDVDFIIFVWGSSDIYIYFILSIEQNQIHYTSLEADINIIILYCNIITMHISYY